MSEGVEDSVDWGAAFASIMEAVDETGGAMEIGTIGWVDLTTENAEQIQDFYSQVVGWKSEPVKMEGYSDYNMLGPDTGEAMAGICHSKGSNQDLPGGWMMYIVVEDLEESLEKCKELGGHPVTEPRGVGGDRFCVIRDPAGSVCALYEPAEAA